MISPDQAERRKGPTYERVFWINREGKYVFTMDPFALPGTQEYSESHIQGRNPTFFLMKYMQVLGFSPDPDSPLNFTSKIEHAGQPYGYSLSGNLIRGELRMIFGIEEKEGDKNVSALCLMIFSGNNENGKEKIKWRGDLTVEGERQGRLIKNVLKRINHLIRAGHLPVWRVKAII